MPDESKLPAGLVVARTPSGGFRFELPRPPGAVRGAVTSIVFLAAVAGAAGYFARDWARGQSVGFLIAAAAFAIVISFGLYCAVRGSFGLRALEVNPEAIVVCLRLPPFAERRKRLALRDVTAVTVTSVFGAKSGGNLHCLEVKASGWTHNFGMGLERPALEWIGARVAALADHARGQAQPGASLQEIFEADRLKDRLESGEVRPEDLVQVNPDEPPPGDAGVEMIERGRGLLRLKLAGGGRGGRSLLTFGVIWLLFISFFTAMIVLSLLGVIKGDRPPLVVCLVLVPFWAVGVGTVLYGLRQRTLVEELEIRPQGVEWRARSILGTNSRSLPGPGLRLSQNVSYTENYQPVYHLRLTAPDGRMVKFAGNLKPEAQAWLLAHIGKALGPETAENAEA